MLTPALVDSYLGVGHSNPQRYIKTLNDAYITFNIPISVAIGETVSIWFVHPTGAWIHTIADGMATIDASGLLQLTNCTATIDGSAVTTGTSVVAYDDGERHELILTVTGADTITYLGQSGVASNYYYGEILSLAHKGTSGEHKVSYIFDTASTTTVYAVGEASPSALYALSRGCIH